MKRNARLACSLAVLHIAVAQLLGARIADAQTVDALRVRQLEQDIAALKRRVLEQDRRIAQLERELSQRSAGSRPPTRAATGAGASAGTGSPVELPWHAPINWDRLKAGMAEPEVVSILGTPSLVRELGGQRIMFYGGSSLRWGSLAGAVELTDGRVSKINSPVFE